MSYAREDQELCRRLVLMLSLVLRERGYRVWWDQTMVAGTWRDQIDDSLGRAVASLLLVSEYSLTSEFIMNEELPRLFTRGRVAPVYARPCPWRSVPVVAGLQFLGSTEQALTERESDGDLAAALTDLAQRAPDFLGLPTLAPATPTGAILDTNVARAEAAIPSDRSGRLHGVPELPINYFSRPMELDALRALVLGDDRAGGAGTASRAVGVEGTGGIGKTVLATALARDSTVRRAFPDGVYWIVLGEHSDPVAAQVGLARMLGLDEGFRSEVDGRSALREALDARRVLLIIDDVWSSAAAEALLVTGTEGRTVLTTRHPLVLARLRTSAVPLGRLGLEEARRFLAQMTFHPEPLPVEADELVEALGGVVLALAVLGATIAHGTSWATALAEVRKAGDVYTDEGFANQFRALQLAWGALDEEERGRYGELVVFGEDVTVPSATVARLWRHTAGLDDATSGLLCTAFAERSLLVLDGGGARLHDQQRAFLLLHAPDSALAHRQLLTAHHDAQGTPGKWSSLPDDEPYLRDHLVEHLVGAGDVSGLQEVVTDPVWLLRRFHHDGPHALEADLERALAALPTFRAGQRALDRIRLISHAMSAVSTIGDRALTLANLGGDLDPRHALDALLPPVRLRLPVEARPDNLERVFVGHPAPSGQPWPRWGGAWSVAWSPDALRLATGGADAAVRIWPTSAAGPPPTTLIGHDAGVRAVAWAPGGRRLASGSDDGTARLWDPADPGWPPVLLIGHAGSVWSVAWSPDGRRLATADSGGTLRVWDPDAPAQPRTVLTGHHGSAWSVEWSPDGRRLASGGADRTVRLWDVLDPSPGRPVVLAGHDGWVWSVAWSPDGQWIASAGDRTVRAWGLDEAASVVLTGHVGLVWSVAWSPDGRRLVSGGADRTVRVWDLVDLSGAAPIVLAGHEDLVWSVAWSPDGRRLASCGQDETARVWSPDAGRHHPVSVVDHGRRVWAVDWSPDGRQLATGTEDGAVRLWDPEHTERADVAVADLTSGVWVVAWAPDGRRLAVGGADRIVRIWDTFATDAPSPVLLTGHHGLVRSAAWAPDGRRLATSGDDGTVRIWDLERVGSRPIVLTGHKGWVPSVAWSGDGRRLASGGDDGMVRVWDARTPGASPVMVGGDLGRVASVAWSPDGRLLAAGAGDGTVGLWDARVWDPPTPDRERPARPPMFAAHSEAVVSLAWSPDGRRLASAGEDRTVRIWDAPAATPVCGVGISNSVFTIAWRGSRIAVGMATRWAVLTVEAPAQAPSERTP